MHNMAKKKIINIILGFSLILAGLHIAVTVMAVEVEPPRIKLNVAIPGLEEFSQG